MKPNIAEVTTDDDPHVKIYFDEYGTNANVDTRSFNKDPISLINLVEKFREGLVFKNEKNMTEKDKKQIRLAIGQAVLDVLRGNKFDAPQIIKNKTQFSVNLEVPFAKSENDGSFKTYTAIVEPKHYQRMYDFLTEIYTQLPLKDRNSEVFADSLNSVFLETEGLTEKRHSDYSDYNDYKNQIHPGNNPKREVEYITAISPVATPDKVNFLYVYCDLIKPRYIADQFARFLRVIPLDGENHHIRFTHIEYCPLERVYFDTVSILLTDSYARKIHFDASYVPTYVMLHFKKNVKKGIE